MLFAAEHAEGAEAFAESEAGDPEPTGGQGLVAAGLFHGELEQDALGFGDETGMGVVRAGLTSLGEDLPGEGLERCGGVGLGGRTFCLGDEAADVIGAHGAVGDDEKLAKEVAELADVAGPGLGLEELDGFGRKRGLADAELATESASEVADEFGNVLGPIPERGQADGELADPVEQVLAEEAFADHPFEVPVGGGDDADVDRDEFVAADAGKGTFLEDAEKLGLGGVGEVSDLVEEHGASGGLLEPADTAADGPGEGAALVTEEFGLEERFGNGGAVDGDEGIPGAVAVLVKGACDQLLAGAGFAADQDIDGLGSDAADLLVDVAHDAALADECILGGVAFAEADGFDHDPSGGDGAGGGGEEFLHVEGLEEVLEGAVFGGLDGGLGGAVGGDEDDWKSRVGAVERLDDLDAGGSGEAPVGEDDVVVAGLGESESGGAVLGGLDRVAFGGEEPLEGGGGARVVLDEEQSG